MPIHHLSPGLAPMATSCNISSLLTIYKNGRPATFVQALGCFIAISKDGISSSLMCKDFLSVLEIRPHIEELSLKLFRQILDVISTADDLYNPSPSSNLLALWQKVNVT